MLEGENSCCKLLLRSILCTVNSTTAYNIRRIELQSGEELKLEGLENNIEIVCKKINFVETPVNEDWKVPAAKELSLIRSRNLSLENFSNDEIEEMLRFICVS